MTTKTHDEIVARVKALLAKAEASTFPAEAEAFSAKAAQMMDEHRITPEAIADSRAEGYGSEMFTLYGNKNLRASLTLLDKVARHYGVLVTIPATGNSKYPTLWGTKSDRAFVQVMFASLIIQRDRAVLSAEKPANVATVAFRNSFAQGYALRIGARLTRLRYDAKAAATADGNGAALVVFDRLKAVEEYAGNPGACGQNKPSLNADGVRAGDAAARLADLGQTNVEGTTGPRAIGA